MDRNSPSPNGIIRAVGREHTVRIGRVRIEHQSARTTCKYPSTPCGHTLEELRVTRSTGGEVAHSSTGECAYTSRAGRGTSCRSRSRAVARQDAVRVLEVEVKHEAEVALRGSHKLINVSC